MTAPNGPSQEWVIRQALANAGVSPADVDAVEAHGTATMLGDPIEARALLATYGQERVDGPLRLGSIKSNIGHTAAAAGVAGVIKIVQALRHGVLPKTLHVDEPTPHVDWSAGEVRLLSEPEPWERGERPRRAGVSSFGVSGTNAHLILEEAPAEEEQERKTAPSEPPTIPFVVSAKTTEALRVQAERLHSHLATRPELNLLDVAHSLAFRRARFKHRAVVVAGDRAQLLSGLEALGRGEPAAGVVDGAAQPGAMVAFLFPGQDAQWEGMGRGLHDAFPGFASALDEVCGEFDRHLGRPLGEVLFAPEGSPEAELLDEAEFTQAALFAVEVALFRLVESWGLTPDYLIGHSIGELVAAHVAGVLSLVDACALVAARGRLMGELPAGGGMVAAKLKFRPPAIPIVSSLTGELLSTVEAASPDYWVRQVREAVRFVDGVRFLKEAGVTRFLELGPDGGLCGMGRECLSADEQGDMVMVPTLRAGWPEPEAVVGSLAELHVLGAEVSFEALLAARGPRLVELPTYAFERRRYWLVPRAVTGDMGAAGLAASLCLPTGTC